MLTGSNLNPDRSDILIYIRRQRYLFATDITKVTKIHKEDCDLQMILWIDEKGAVVPYHFTTVTHGIKAAPFLAVSTLLQLVEDEGSNYPLTVPSIIHGSCVVDIVGSANTPKQQLIKVALQ
ncbi:PREDICTED: uncharacterized protein LOC105365975 [Ceratosolen solmsi marchali]|uniref:Uncharacterized protein LOC105365975 n=1 Tax=Ceratosolen solmsi marchali TaxID=326594 RepID=A0AAJ6YQW1_9HYME|nr:PREDICTED: uncharacterized protein LOC105365975 [Ceratosolen solmsi marchali]